MAKISKIWARKCYHSSSKSLLEQNSWNWLEIESVLEKLLNHYGMLLKNWHFFTSSKFLIFFSIFEWNALETQKGGCFLPNESNHANFEQKLWILERTWKKTNSNQHPVIAVTTYNKRNGKQIFLCSRKKSLQITY